MENLSLSIIVLVLLMGWLLNYLPFHKPDSERWSKRKVKDCGGILFFPVCLVVGLSLGFPLELLVAGGAIWALGLKDDLISIKPWEKLVVQIGIASFLILCGWRVDWFNSTVLNIIVSLFWIVGLTNSLNMLDNMDGLTVGVSAIAFSFLFILTSNSLTSLLAIICIAFLVFNFPPARVFMGDCGAMFLGLNLACLSMGIGPYAILLLAVPIADTTFVTVRRLLKKRSPAKGGLDHLSHEIARKTNSDFVPLAILWGVGLVCGFIVINLL